ncbi:MAG: hypothetical protein KME45_28065 [Stenomitos rutilans HA7619-LM2]|nr:hypothetical protein [Stenomitos rutilans HA7619-LM2]
MNYLPYSSLDDRCLKTATASLKQGCAPTPLCACRKNRNVNALFCCTQSLRRDQRIAVELPH